MWPGWPRLTSPSLAQAVGGNAALALLLTVGTNLAGIFTMPFMLCWLLDTGGSAVALSPGPLLRSLLKTILLPLLVGAGSRAFIPGACIIALSPSLSHCRCPSADCCTLGIVVALIVWLSRMSFCCTTFPKASSCLCGARQAHEPSLQCESAPCQPVAMSPLGHRWPGTAN